MIAEDLSLALEPITLDLEDVSFLHDLAREYGIEYFNLRLAKGKVTSISILRKITKSSNMGIGKGISLITFINGGYGFAVGHDYTPSTIRETFIRSAKLAKWSAQFVQKPFHISTSDMSRYTSQTFQKTPLSTIDPEQKITDLLRIEVEAYRDPRIISTDLEYMDREIEQIYYNSAGRMIRAQDSGVYILIQAIAKENQRQEGYHVTHGGVGGYEFVEAAHDVGTIAATNALELLRSKPAPRGQHNMILDPLLTGTFIHEAFGHATEADAVLAGESILTDCLQKPVGPSNVTICDDGTLPGQFGTIPIDDEGTPASHTILVKNGILVNYLHSLETASKMESNPTGNARAGGYSLLPLVRMTNTYLEPGNSSYEEMLQEMKNGLLGIGWKYGYCDPITGSLMFKCAKAYLVEEGRPTKLFHDLAISGLTLDVLSRIQLISKEMKMDCGHCGKAGQSVTVGSGGPYTYITDMITGGE